LFSFNRQTVLEDADSKLTRQAILEDWPPDYDVPKSITLWRALDHALKQNLIARDGAGRKSDQFPYWLPEREAVWKLDPIYEMMEEQRRLLKDLPKKLTEEMIRDRLQSARRQKPDDSSPDS
jgi:hypothetical protein